jgi:hypothetical protein
MPSALLYLHALVFYKFSLQNKSETRNSENSLDIQAEPPKLSVWEIVFLHVCVLCASCVKKINAKDAIVATVNKRLRDEHPTFNFEHRIKTR